MIPIALYLSHRFVGPIYGLIGGAQAFGKGELAYRIPKGAIAFDAELAWRKRAEAGLKNGLAAYDAAIRDTIGLRGQPRLPKEQALYVASCNAGHRDISLSF